MKHLSKLTNQELLEYHALFRAGASKSKRFQDRKKNNTDTKFLYHVVRLLSECEQILIHGDMDLQKNNEELKAIRRGEWSEDKLRKWASDKEADLEKLYHSSTLPWGPDEEQIKKLLLECLEIHYGSLDGCVVQADRAVIALRNIYQEIMKVSTMIGA